VCERDTAGNRTLHYDQYCMLLLLYFFKPIVTSLRGLLQANLCAYQSSHISQQVSTHAQDIGHNSFNGEPAA